MANYTNRGSHYKAASREEKRRPWRKKGLAVLACLLAVAFAAGVAALAVPGLFRSGDEATLTKTIYWWDNDNEDGKRPGVDKYEKPVLVLGDEANDVQYKSDDPDALALLKSLNYPDGWPDVVVAPDQGNTWKVTTNPKSLNKIVYEVDEDGNLVATDKKVTWSLSQGFPPEVEGYTAIYAELAGELGDLFGSFSTVGEDDWHYVKSTDYTFTIDLRSGSLENLSGITDAILQQFELEASFTAGGEQKTPHVSLAELEGEPGYATVQFQVKDDGDEEWENIDLDNPDAMKAVHDELRLSLTMPKYTIEGQPITYKVAEANTEEKPADGKLDYQIPGFEGTDDAEDYFAIKYDNTNATNHGSATDGAYSGGSVILTLTGTTDYKATKVWQDKDGKKEDRPADVTLELWRYVAGQPLESAAAVRDSAGNIYTCPISAQSDSGVGVPVMFYDADAETDAEGNKIPAAFPKYDPEGNRYIYVVKEYGLDGNYTQVFGEVDPSTGDVSGDFIKDLDGDGVVYDNVGGRQSGNTYLYNGGTLNNVLNGTTTATATKVWNASAFQAEFGGVTVELTLQSRPSKEGQGAEEGWTNTNETYSLTGFQAENLAGLSYSGAFPQYDNLGRKLEYRWVETNVTQVLTDENGAETEFTTGFTRDETTGTATFTLKQKDFSGNTREVKYTSETEVGEDGNPKITNSVANQVHYEVDKWWALKEDEEVPEDAESNPNYWQDESGQWYTKDISADGNSTIQDSNAEKATFYLYRVESGQQVPMDEPGGYYLAFTMTKDEVTFFDDPGSVTDEEFANIKITETGEGNPWHVNITGLPEFDEGGRQYDYVLVEADASPRYETERESDGYYTEVYNPRGPGEVLQILVQKNWIDDSDTVHREPVVIQAYKKSTGEKIEDASVTLENGLWYDWITIQLGSSGQGEGNNPNEPETNPDTNGNGGEENIQPGGEPTQPDDSTIVTGGETEGGETETDGNTDVTTQPGEENDETEEITNTDSDNTPEESEVSESLLANEGKALAAPKTGDGEGEIQDPLNENEGSTGNGGTPSGGTEDAKPDGVQSIKDIYLLEVSIGEVSVKNTLKDGDLSDGIGEDEEPWYDQVTGDVTSQYHRYQVTYSDFTPIDGTKPDLEPGKSGKYSATVTNRRLGNIDITVHKVWNSGEIGSKEEQALQLALHQAKMPGSDPEEPGGLSLALKLTFHESMGTEHGYTIGDDYVMLGKGAEETPIYNVERKVKDETGEAVPSDEGFTGEEPGSSVIKIYLPDEAIGDDGEKAGKEQTYYFNNLPKFDTTGTIVRYTVEEGLVSEDGTFISFDEYIAKAEPGDALAKELKKWVHTMKEVYYVAASDPGAAIPTTSTKDVDFQTFEATNSLTGTKDVQWYKEWNDAYRNEAGERPDIFLDVFRLVHTDDDNTRLELVVKDYQWTPTEDKDPVNYWTATMEGVPLYDSLGYEITYFAVERAVNDTERFDYGPVRYYNTKGDLMGDRLEVDSEYLEETAEGVLYACSLKDGDDYVEVVGLDEPLGERYAARKVNYALGEGGTFENYLRANPNLAGSKLWQGVESGYPTDQLPQVTFALYQTTLGKETEPENPDAETDPENPGEEVATLQVNWGGDFGMLNGSLTTDFWFFMKGDWQVDWKDDRYVYTSDESSGTYYVNSDWEVVNENGDDIELPDDVRLPQYDEEGNRYAYTMVERSVTMMGPNGKDKITIKLDPTTGEPSEDNEEEAVAFYKSIFKNAKMTDGATFQATNVYNDEQEGQLAVEKWLNVGETTPVSYPAIQVELYRAVTSQKDNEDAWRLVDSHIWKSNEVQEKFTGDTPDAWGYLEYTFENLPIYAPNGEKYVYKVVEVKEDFLDGYDTWAVEGPVAEGDLDGKMEDDNRKEVVSDLEATEVLEGSETTPDLDTATFINKRDADSVKLQGTKVWEDWGDEMELRPSDAENVITLTVSRRADAQPGENNAIESQPLTAGTDYTVSWNIPEDNNGEPWTYTITGANGEELEQYAPNGMPWIYQVTETISDPYDYYNASTNTVTFGTEPVNGFLTISGTTPITNSLKTSAAFQKKWVDEDNKEISTDYFGDVTVEFKLQVAFAPDTGAEADWQDAETFFTNDTARDGQVSVPSSVLNMGTYQFEGSTNEANGWQHTFSNLPRAVKVGGETTKLTYRVVETKVTYTLPGEENATEVEVEINGDKYTVTDSKGIFTEATLTEPTAGGATWTTTNTMRTVDLTITKKWVDQNNKYHTRPEGENGEWVVDFLIQYQDAEDVETGTYHNVTTKDDEPLIVSISGTAENEGTTTVKDLPYVEGRQYYAFELEPGYTTDNVDEYICDENGGTFHIGYTVDYGDENPVQVEEPTDGQTDFITTATNTLDTTSVSVKKNWEPEKLPGGDQYPSVTMKVQYKSGPNEDDWEDLEGCTVTLNGSETLAWEHTFEDLPKYYPEAAGYAEKRETQYRVVELDGDGYVQVEEKYDGENKTFTFTNKPVVDFTVTKQWNSVPEAAYNWQVTVGLYRTTEEVTDYTSLAYDVEHMVTNENGQLLTVELYGPDNLTATFEDLDKYYMDETTGDCLEYTYYVKELTVGGDKIEGASFTKEVDGKDVAFTVDYTYAENAATVVNRVEGSLQVKKVWHDKGGESARPETITVGLYRFDKASQDYEAVKDPSNLEKNYTLTLDEENDWQGTFENLPEYYSDGNGNRGEKIQYAVYELENGTRIEQGGTLTATDDGSYTVYYDGFTIHNVREVDLTIEKTVTGDAADPERKFAFEVGFTYDETMPEAIHTGPYTYTVYQKGDGDEATQVKQDTIPSREGTITLTGGQYAVIEGLPAGTAYTVTEQEANQDGYVTTATNASGTVTVDGENKVSFTNCRAPGDLIIRKEVTGSGGDRSKEWTFHLKADLPDGRTLCGEVACERNGKSETLFFDEIDGYATFILKSGESLTIKDLPNGTVFTVTEAGANQGGYTTTVDGTGALLPDKDGRTGTIDAEDNNLVTFTNHKPGGGGPGPGPTPTPTPEPEETPTPEPGETPTPAPEGSPSPEPSGTPGPDGTPTPAPSGSPSPSGSPTPGPGGSPTPAPTPTPPGGDTPDDTPQTGDPTHTLWWALAGAGALAGLGALWATRPKGHKARHRKK
ncbi:MAG TPA: Cna B-type domain-containing protein [Candidatus Acutalibacter stercorigallinarum]|nr:Cna B-type domain-containing protein [Candidatus Acutalibacter stercorigallinarum]